MKAVLWNTYGPPELLQVGETRKPIPGDKEILVKIEAATVTLGDCEVRSLKLPLLFKIVFRLYMGILRPSNKILGQELAGTIEGVGKDVKKFKPGDQIFAPTTMYFGAYAEYICLPAKHPIALKSESLSFEEAATIPTGGLNALHFVRKSNIKPREKVLINGAGGSIGTYALQLAKLEGAEVTAVDSAIKSDMLTSLGAIDVIDYQKQDFTKTGKKYDVIIDVVGKSSFSGSIKALNPKGRYVLGNPNLVSTIRGKLIDLVTNKKIQPVLAPYKIEDLEYLQDLIVSKKVKVVIDKQYPLEKVAEAHDYVEKGYKKGNVIIQIKP